MASDDWNPQYEEYEAEFNTLREDMDALGIGASFKPLISYEIRELEPLSAIDTNIHCWPCSPGR